MNTPNAPWLKFYGDIPKTLEYPQISMYEAVVNAGKTHSQVNAYEFQGKGTTYAKFIEKNRQNRKGLQSSRNKRRRNRNNLYAQCAAGR